MKTLTIKKSLVKNAMTGVGLLTTALLFGLVGCTSHVSPGALTASATADNLVYPEQSKTWQTAGVSVDPSDIAKIKVGTTKDEIYHLIGAPHYSEGFNAREWDYTLKFHDQNHKVETCRYKILFNNYSGRLLGDTMQVKETHWQPESCAMYAQHRR